METPQFSFSVFSDPHFMAWKESNLPVDSVSIVEQSFEDALQMHPQWVAIIGDLTNGKIRDYKLASRILSQYTETRFFYTMGNHEYYGCYEDNDYSNDKAQERFLQYTNMPSIYYKVEFQGFSFLFLSTEYYSKTINDAGWLSDAQLHWLDDRLYEQSQQNPNKPVFVFFHQPVNETVAESKQTCVQSDALRHILSQHQHVLFFSGHTHCNMDRIDQYVTDGSITFVGGGCPHGDHPQSRFVEVYHNRIIIRVRDHKAASFIKEHDHTVWLPS